jgi:hypothetical protein
VQSQKAKTKDHAKTVVPFKEEKIKGHLLSKDHGKIPTK